MCEDGQAACRRTKRSRGNNPVGHRETLFLLVAEKAHDLIHLILLLSWLLAFLSGDSSKDRGSASQGIVCSGHQPLQFHLSHFLNIGRNFWILESTAHNRWYDKLSLIICQRRAHVVATCGAKIGRASCRERV